MSQQRILQEVVEERTMQDLKWGGRGHDASHTDAEWIALLARHLGLAVDDGNVSAPRFRKQMIRVAALAVAAVEAFDRRTGCQNHIGGYESTGSGF